MMVKPEQTSEGTRIVSWSDLFAEAAPIVEHTIALAVAIISIWFINRMFLYFLGGEDAHIFDVIQIRYLIDAGHLAVFFRFIWKLVIHIWQ